MSMDFSEKWGTDVDTAVQLALEDLKLTLDEVKVTVLEEPSRGFFGIGSKLALVRVEKKSAHHEEKKDNKPAKFQDRAEKAQPQKAESKRDNQDRREHKDREFRRDPERGARRQEDRAGLGREAGEPREERAHHEAREIRDIKLENLVPCDDHEALRFLREVTKEMGLELEITAKKGEEAIFLDIQGKDSGTIIGKRGQTLDAIQYLTSLVANKDCEEYTRVVVDAENYRAKREKTLESLANRLAGKVIRTRRSVKLEPMNPYERKVIHAALHNHPKVVTRSEGQDPYRRVIIELK